MRVIRHHLSRPGMARWIVGMVEHSKGESYSSNGPSDHPFACDEIIGEINESLQATGAERPKVEA